MYFKETTIRNATGFHIRPAQLFTEKAAAYRSTVKLKVNETGTEVDGKSILGLMSLGLGEGAVITITADGIDEQEVVDELAALVEGGFGEV